LKRYRPNTRKAKKPIKATRTLIIVAKIPLNASNSKKPEMVPDMASHNHIAPDKNPRKIPKVLEEV